MPYIMFNDSLTNNIKIRIHHIIRMIRSYFEIRQI